jgi:hypothetical protein
VGFFHTEKSTRPARFVAATVVVAVAVGAGVPFSSASEGLSTLGAGEGERGLGGSTTVTQTMASNGIRVKPMARIDHAKLTLWCSRRRWSVTGQTTPPIEAPPMAKPTARPRWCGICLMMTPKGAQNTSDMAAPRNTPCAKMSCQYVSQRDVANTAASVPALPMHSSRVGPNRSTSGPANPAPR